MTVVNYNEYVLTLGEPLKVLNIPVRTVKHRLDA